MTGLRAEVTKLREQLMELTAVKEELSHLQQQVKLLPMMQEQIDRNSAELMKLREMLSTDRSSSSSNASLASLASPSPSPSSFMDAAGGGGGGGGGGAASAAEEEYELTTVDSWDKMGLKEQVLRGLMEFGYEKPSPVQELAVVPFVKGKDLLVQAQSGTGKTAAFAVGLLQQCDPLVQKTQVLVICPTCDIAEQHARIIRSIGHPMGVTVQTLVSGTMEWKDRNALLGGVQVVVATPGRLYKLMTDKKVSGWYKSIKTVVIDEADQMLVAPFVDQIRLIGEQLPAAAQVCLFSATMPLEVQAVANGLLRPSAVRILVQPTKLALAGIKQFSVDVNDKDWDHKAITTFALVNKLSLPSVLIFCKKQEGVVKLAETMAEEGFSVAAMHGDLMGQDRSAVLDAFRTGKVSVLVTTGVLARGIDFQGLQLVINFDLPTEVSTYLHQTGRVGRFGRKGTVINLVTPWEKAKMEEIAAFYEMVLTDLPADLKSILK